MFFCPLGERNHWSRSCHWYRIFSLWRILLRCSDSIHFNWNYSLCCFKLLIKQSNAQHAQLHWWHYHLSRFHRCYFDPDHSGYSVSFLFQFSPKEMTSQEKLDYIYLTLKSFQELLPKTENVVLDVNDDKLHQLSARTLISLDFATSIHHWINDTNHLC